MARPAKVKTISAAEKKAQIAGLKTALAQHNGNIKSIAAETKAAQAALAAAKKSADALTKEAEKAAAAGAKGTEKLNAQLEARNAMPLTETPKAGSAPKQKAVRETAEA